MWESKGIPCTLLVNEYMSPGRRDEKQSGGDNCWSQLARLDRPLRIIARMLAAVGVSELFVSAVNRLAYFQSAPGPRQYELYELVGQN